MKFNWFMRLLSISILSSSAIITGCGGGGSSDSTPVTNGDTAGTGGTDTSADIVALSPPEQVDIVSATASSTTTSNFVRALMNARAFNDAATEYTLDEQHAHVWHPALEPIETVNSILCFIDQLRADEMLGRGAYAALVDDAKCEEGASSDSSSSGNQSSGADQAPDFVEVVALSTRASNSDPMVVSLWIPEMEMGDDGSSVLIKAKVTVTSSPSDTQPFGEFSMSFGFFPEGGTTSTGGGVLSTISNNNNQFGFNFYETNSQNMDLSDVPNIAGEVTVNFTQAASVLTNAEQTDGVAVTQTNLAIDGIEGNPFEGIGGGPSNKAFALSFDPEEVKVRSADDYSALLADNGLGDVCLSRNDYREAVWRYNLYEVNTGERVAVNSGFPFRYATSPNAPETYDGFGYVGYWGVWTESDNGLSNGQTIIRDNHGEESETPDTYSVTTAPGKLIKYSTESLALTELNGIEFHYWDSELESSGEANYDQWIVEYLTAAADEVSTDGFYKTAGLSYHNFESSHGGPSSTAITPRLITLESEYDSLHMWSQQLGGGVNWRTGDTDINFFSEEFIDGDETGVGELFEDQTSVTLYCYDNCPVGTLELNDLSTYDSAFENPLYTESETVTPIQYTFSISGDGSFTLIRTDSSESVVMAPSLTREQLQTTFHSWGIQTGHLVTEPLTNAYDIYDASLVATFYKWETGLDDWNRMSIVKQNDAVVTFDKPIEFRYTHAIANDRSSDESIASRFDGQTFMLNYGGNGNLWGIPHRAVGEATDEVTENDEHIRYYPLFNLTDGAVLGPNDAYVVKAIDIEQKMARNPSGCINLNYDGLVEPPSGLGESYDVEIGDLPAIDESPAVVAGEVQVVATE